MQNGPRGPSDPNTKGGMSPMTLAILGVLAYKAVKHLAGSQATTGPVTPAPSLGKTANRRPLWRRARRFVQGWIWWPARSGAAGSVISGGLGDLLKAIPAERPRRYGQFMVSSGPNKPISVDDLTNVLGADQSTR